MEELAINVEISYWSFTFRSASLWLPIPGAAVLLLSGVRRGIALRYFILSIGGVIAIYLLLMAGVVSVGEARHLCDGGCSWAEKSYQWLTKSDIPIIELVTLTFVLIVFIFTYRSERSKGDGGVSEGTA